MPQNKTDLIIRLRAQEEKLRRDLAKSQNHVKRFSNQTKQVSNKINASLAGAFAIFTSGQLIMSIVETTGKYQKFAAVLTNTLGSGSEAEKALNMISEFAASTPFAVDELTGSFVKLANQGFKPTREEMRKLGDLAASTGKGFDQLAEAILDAQTGEFERLKEFGIRSAKEGDKVTFTFKGVQRQVDFTSQSITNYLLSLGDLNGVQGSTAAIADTVAGKISNMGDNVDLLKKKIGDSSSGLISALLDLANTGLGAVTKALDTPFDKGRQVGFGILEGIPEDIRKAAPALKAIIDAQTQALKAAEWSRNNNNFLFGGKTVEAQKEINQIKGTLDVLKKAYTDVTIELQNFQKAQATLTRTDPLGLKRKEGSIAPSIIFPSADDLPDPVDVSKYFIRIRESFSTGMFNVVSEVSSYSKMMTTVLLDLGNTIRGGLTAALSGLESGNLKLMFSSLLMFIGDNLQKLGIGLVAFGEALEAFTIGDPATKVLAGIAAIAAGTLIKGAARNLASAGKPNRGGAGRNLGGFGRTASQNALVGEFTVKGSDLKLVLARANADSTRIAG